MLQRTFPPLENHNLTDTPFDQLDQNTGFAHQVSSLVLDHSYHLHHALALALALALARARARALARIQFFSAVAFTNIFVIGCLLSHDSLRHT